MRNRIYQNLPNVASIMGIIQLGLLLLPDGFRFLIPVIIFNNFMDDLDGVLASRLNLKSDFGAILDNVCDVVSHTIFVLLIGVYFGAPSSVAAVVAAISMILRISLRLKIPPLPSRGTATNELVRHLLFLLLLSELFVFNGAMLVCVLCLVHGFTMLAPFEMPHLIRSRTRSPGAIALVNLALLTAWLVPLTVVPIAICFLGAYLYSLVTQGGKWMLTLNELRTSSS
jgi:archaetidylserine synthase